MSRCAICGDMCCAGNAEELIAKDKRIEKLEAAHKFCDSNVQYLLRRNNKAFDYIERLEAILDSLLDGLECSEDWNGCGWCQICKAKRAMRRVGDPHVTKMSFEKQYIEKLEKINIALNSQLERALKTIAELRANNGKIYIKHAEE